MITQNRRLLRALVSLATPSLLWNRLEMAGAQLIHEGLPQSFSDGSELGLRTAQEAPSPGEVGQVTPDRAREASVLNLPLGGRMPGKARLKSASMGGENSHRFCPYWP